MSQERNKVCILGDRAAINQQTLEYVQFARSEKVVLCFYNYGDKPTATTTEQTSRDDVSALVKKSTQKIYEADVIFILADNLEQLEKFVSALENIGNTSAFKRKSICVYCQKGEIDSSSVQDRLGAINGNRLVRFLHGDNAGLQLKGAIGSSMHQRQEPLQVSQLLALNDEARLVSQLQRSAGSAGRQKSASRKNSSCCSLARACRVVGVFGAASSVAGGAVVTGLAIAGVLTFTPAVIAAIASSVLLALLFLVINRLSARYESREKINSRKILLAQ